MYNYLFLQGLLYTDRMFPLTFEYNKWDKENYIDEKKNVIN